MGKRILVIGSSARHVRRWFHYVTPILQGEIIVDIYATDSNAKEDFFEGANKVFLTCETPRILAPLTYIPKIRSIIRKRNCIKTFESILSKNDYDVLHIQQVSVLSYYYTKIAKEKGLKVILTPWGSDVLRCPQRRVPMLKDTFKRADVVTYNIERFSEKYISRYNVNPKIMIYAGYGSEIFDLIPQLKGKYTKKEISKVLNVPSADYYITCGYTADHVQRHKVMIQSIGENREFLPPNTLLLFPFIYGDGKKGGYKSELIKLCDKYKLSYCFVTDYLTNEQMALFRLLADLFIHIQPSDAGSASLVEYLLAGAQCVNGKWLDYPHLEEGGIPYHVCESLETLPSLLNVIFCKKMPKRQLSDVVRAKMMEGAWTKQKEYWKSLLENI